MSREVIQDFLHSAGVVGVALTNRRMRPYFYGLDTVLDRSKQALGQGVLQVVENVPEGFESFEFHFAGHVVFIYKLTHGLVLLVLTDSGLNLVDYRKGITKIKYLIETDAYNTVAYFKLLLGSVTQHSLPSTNWKNPNDAITIGREHSATNTTVNPAVSRAVSPNAEAIAATSSTTPNPRANVPVNTAPANISANTSANTTNDDANTRASSAASNNRINVNVQTQTNINKTQAPPTSNNQASTTAPTSRTVASNNPATVTNSNTKSVSAKTDPQEYKLDELLATLNKLSQFTTQYLGKVVVTNYWKSSRPDVSWLAEFEIDRGGQISHPKQKAIACNPEQLQQIQTWVAAYIKRCKQVIRNFDQMLEQDCLDSRQRQILMM